MVAILSLFARSPFAPLQSHMEKVSKCIYLIEDLFEALQKKDYERLDTISKKIVEQEQQADQTKNDIRNHLPKTLFLPIDRSHILEILAIQDNIGDLTEDIASLITIKTIEIQDSFREEFKTFLKMNIETFNGAKNIIHEMHELLETSFGGFEAKKVKVMVDNVVFKENEAALAQKKLLKILYNSEKEMTYTTFYLWQKIFNSLNNISKYSEKLAYRVRMTLELK